MIEGPTGLASTYQNKTRIVLKYDDVPGQTLEIFREGVALATDTGGWYTDLAVVSGTSYSYQARWIVAGVPGPVSAPIVARNNG